MTTQHNATFNELVFNAVSEATRVSNSDKDFTSQFKDTLAEPIPAMPGERDNDIFNLGVHEGATTVLNRLHKEGYVISNPAGEVVVPSEGNTFGDDYYSRKYWEQVSS